MICKFPRLKIHEEDDLSGQACFSQVSVFYRFGKKVNRLIFKSRIPIVI